jgi:transcriptional regulator with XRE-family HTH domain
MGFGSEVRRLREQMGLSQTQFAERVGISQPYLARIEGEKHQAVAIDVAFHFADMLGVPVDHFRQFFPSVPVVAAGELANATAVISKRK